MHYLVQFSHLNTFSTQILKSTPTHSYFTKMNDQLLDISSTERVVYLEVQQRSNSMLLKSFMTLPTTLTLERECFVLAE